MQKTNNFLNNQKYILGEKEEKKVISSFINLRILKKVILISQGIVFFIIRYCFSHYLTHRTDDRIAGTIILFVYFLAFYFSFSLESYINYVFLNKTNMFIVSFNFIFGFALFISSIVYKEPLGILVSFFILFGLFFSVGRRINYINIFLVPVIFPIGIVLFFLIYLIGKFDLFVIKILPFSNQKYVNIESGNDKWKVGVYEIYNGQDFNKLTIPRNITNYFDKI